MVFTYDHEFIPESLRIEKEIIRNSRIVISECLHEGVGFSINVDELHFPKTRQSLIHWVESQQQRMLNDNFRWMADLLHGETIGTINTFACNRRNGSMLFTDGQFHDEIYFGMTRDEFYLRYSNRR